MSGPRDRIAILAGMLKVTPAEAKARLRTMPQAEIDWYRGLVDWVQDYEANEFE